MGTGPLLLGYPSLHIERIRFTPEGVVLDLISTIPFSDCPQCGQRSVRVHSHYSRHLRDLPAHGRVIQLNLHLRRFVCDHPDCPKQTFAERLPQVTQPRARRTDRLTEAMRDIAFVSGGEGGARLGRKLALPTSPDTLLRLMRQAPVDVPSTAPQVLGVDDWSIRRAQRFGTILCDLERHKPIDLLEDRSCQVLATWLGNHPGAQIIARDRGGDYARGAAIGAPDAVQVADRWHLLCNLTEALQEAIDREYGLISQAARAAAAGAGKTGASGPPPINLAPAVSVGARVARQARDKKLQQQRRAKRLARYEQVKQLQAQGLSLQQIRTQLKLSRWAIRRFARAQQFPERATSCPHRRKTELDGFVDYLRQRWEQGCHNSRRLWKELKEKGYSGGPYTVRRRLSAWREPNDVERAREPANSQPSTARDKRVWKPSSRAVAWLLLEPAPAADSPEKQAFLTALHQLWPELDASVILVQEFRRMVHDREEASLEAWVQLAQQDKTIVPEVRRFAARLSKDWPAVIQAVKGDWSSGQVEGQINRLKLIKRQMYGRANLDLLRQRVLHAN